MLDDLSAKLPDFVWMSSLQQGANNVTIRGMASSYVSIADYIQKLEESDFFQNVELIDARQGKDEFTSFQLQAQLMIARRFRRRSGSRRRLRADRAESTARIRAMALDLGKMSLSVQIVIFLVLAAALYGGYWYFFHTGTKNRSSKSKQRGKAFRTRWRKER